MKLKLTLLAIVLLSGCEARKTAAPEVPTFTFRIASEPPNIDPLHGVDQISIDIMNNIMEGLLQFDPDMNVVPALAKSFSLSKDACTYTFQLRSGIKWPDGVPFEAKHVIESWQSMLDPKSGAEYAYFFYPIVGAEDYNTGKTKDFSQVQVKALDALTVEVKLKKPVAYFPSLLAAPAMFPFRVDVYSKFPQSWTEPEHIQTLGAYKLTKWEHDKQMVFDANENYFEGAPKLKRAVALIVKDGSTAVNLFESGKLDLVRRLPLPDMDRFKNDPRLKIEPYFRNYYYAFDQNQKPFSDARVRKAFGHAIKRDDLQRILRAGQKIVKSWIPLGMVAADDSIGLDFDPLKAKKLLSDAGYPDGKNFPKITFAFDAREDNQMVAEALQQMWKTNLNVALEIRSQEFKMYLSNLKTSPPPLFRYGWGADYPDPHNFMDVFLSNSGNNFTHWKSKKYDSLVEQGSTETDLAKRKAIYDQAQKLLLEDDAVILPLFNESSNYLVQPRVKNFGMDRMANLFLKRYSVEER